MITKIMGEAPFQVLTNNFSISPSNEGYTLQISADGKNYSNLFQVGANVTRLVTGVAANSYYRLLGNNSEVSINWMKTCVTEGGGSGSGVTPEEVQAQIDSALTPYWDSADTKDYVDEAISGVSIDLSDYYTSAQTESAITMAVSGKADAQNVTARESGGVVYWVPTWNEQGVITGDRDAYFKKPFSINGVAQTNFLIAQNSNLRPIYAPEAPGNVGEILVSSGNGAPVWSAVTFPSQEDFNFISGRVQTNEEVVSEALNDLNDRIEEISGNTGGSTEDIELPIAAAINEVRDTFNTKLSQQYYKKQEVNDIAARKMEAGQVNEQIVSYVDPLIEEVYDTIEDKELPVSAAINELNEKKVEGINVKAIWAGSQIDYDAIVTKDPDTLYIIK